MLSIPQPNSASALTPGDHTGMTTHTGLKQVLDSLKTSIILLDSHLVITKINASAEILLGVSDEQISGKPISVCFTENDNTPTNLQQACDNGQTFTKRKATWNLHHQQDITVDYTVTPNPELNQVTIEVHPLDRLMRISREEALISSQETSQNLVRSLAHEIKNPLGGIRGAAQLLSKKLDNEELEEYTRIIIDETDRLRNLVDQLLGPRKPTKREPTNIHEVLEHVSTVIAAEVGNKIRIVRDYDPSIPELKGDKEQLIQATLNIARNAVQALLEDSTQQDKVVTFSTRIKRKYTIRRAHHPLVVRVAIKNNGPDIPADIIEDIFFPMITGRAEGTGLGLSIAQNLVGQHDGLIECESQNGLTEFAIYIPLGSSYA